MTDESRFRFDWEVLFEARFLLPSSESVGCSLSKAYLNDIDIINMAFDDETTDLSAVNVNSENSNTEVTSTGDGLTESDSATALLEDAADLAETQTEYPAEPTDLSEETVGVASKAKKVQKSIRSRLKEMDFDDYWDNAGRYLVDYCYANDFAEDMSGTLRKFRPEMLIGAHHSKRPISGIRERLPSDIAVGSEQFMELYAEVVKDKAREDFQKYKDSLTPNKCRAFLQKVAKMGYLHGFDHMDAYDVLPRKRQANKSEETEEVKRKLPNYDGMELFTDVDYESYESVYFGNQRLVHYNMQEGVNAIPSSSDENEATDAEHTDVAPLVTESNVNYDFGFDPKRDAKLIARDANKVMRGDKEIMKYWFQRYRLFSKLNEDILMDREGWFSVTPERIGEHIADRMVTRTDCVVLDGFTGVGGNAIQFALKGAYVYAVDLDPIKLRCALQNARVYGVADRITFICGNFFHIAQSFFGSRKDAESEGQYGVDAVFLSPPWGGPSYLQEKIYDLAVQEPNGYEIYRIARRISPNIGYFLPRNTSIKQLISLAGPGGKVEIEHDVLNGKLKTLTAYYGELVAT